MSPTLAQRRKRIGQILKALEKLYPSPKCALDFKTPFELLVATVLSAQSTDVQVNKLTATLFRKYRTIEDYAEARIEDLQADVAKVNFYRNKAANIQKSARLVLDRFGGKVPRTMEELVTLPGVARKTANIILSSGYGIIEGIAVDTHVLRLSARLGLSEQSNPVKVERDLMEATPRERWADLSHLLILHGRSVCNARKPLHPECALIRTCPSRDI